MELKERIVNSEFVTLEPFEEVADEGAANTSQSSLSEFGGSIKRLMSNRGYVLLLITYGLNVGVFYAISTLLNLIIVQHFTVNKLLTTYIGS